MIATLFAVKELMTRNALKVNLCFLYEGEEESQSAGFRDAVRAKASWLESARGLLFETFLRVI